MRIYRAIILLCTIFFLLLMVSCIEADEAAPTREELLAGSDTQGRSYYISAVELAQEDFSGELILNECVTDNTFVYYPNGRYEENEGRTKCDPSDPPGVVGSWIISDNGRELHVTIDRETTTWEILSITDDGHEIVRPSANGEVIFYLERFL